MIVLYEVIHSVGQEEQKTYVVSEGATVEEAEINAVSHYTGTLNLINANHYKLAENPELVFQPTPSDPVPTQITRRDDGLWEETQYA